MERYCRCVVYRRYNGPQARPDDERLTAHASFDTLVEAAQYVGFALADGDADFYTYEVRDLENIEMGDMLTNSECSALASAAIDTGARTWAETP